MKRPVPPPRPRRKRDQQRSAVYAAEDQVARILDRSADFPVIEVVGSRLTLPPEKHFANLASVQRYVDAVLALDWVRAQWPGAAAQPVTVRQRRGTTRAHYELAGAVIAVPLHQGGTAWALREMVILHEVAHHLGGDGDTGHGPCFRARMLELAGALLGPEVALLLRVALADQGAAISKET